MVHTEIDTYPTITIPLEVVDVVPVKEVDFNTPTTVVIGAGVAGLSAALSISRAYRDKGVSHQVVVFETSDKPGGKAARLISPFHRKLVKTALKLTAEVLEDPDIKVITNTDGTDLPSLLFPQVTEVVWSRGATERRIKGLDYSEPGIMTAEGFIDIFNPHIWNGRVPDLEEFGYRFRRDGKLLPVLVPSGGKVLEDVSYDWMLMFLNHIVKKRQHGLGQSPVGIRIPEEDMEEKGNTIADLCTEYGVDFSEVKGLVRVIYRGDLNMMRLEEPKSTQKRTDQVVKDKVQTAYERWSDNQGVKFIGNREFSEMRSSTDGMELWIKTENEKTGDVYLDQYGAIVSAVGYENDTFSQESIIDIPVHPIGMGVEGRGQMGPSIGEGRALSRNIDFSSPNGHMAQETSETTRPDWAKNRVYTLEEFKSQLPKGQLALLES